MKLSKIYSNKPFRTVQFSDGVNVILAKIKNKSNKDADSHNLGKTSLITLIDFLLLKTVTSSHIFKTHFDKFAGHNFFLELKLNNGRFLTIKRSVDNNTKISFKNHNESKRDYVEETEWDKEDLPFQKAREFLNSQLNYDAIEKYDYRKPITYFLRNQYDYQDVFQLSKFSRGKDLFWKPFIFDLLGFEGELPKEKYELESDKKDLENIINEFKDKFSVSPDEVDKLKGGIEIRKDERDKLTEEIDSFSFYAKERNLNKELVEEIEEEIAELNSIEYDLKYEIERLKNSYNSKVNFDLDGIDEIFQETKINFPDQLKREYEELVEFNKEITHERNGQISVRIDQLSERHKKVVKRLKDLDARRTRVLSVLKNRSTFDKFKVYQKELSSIEGEIARLTEKLDSIDKIKELREEVRAIDKKIEDKVLEIEQTISDQGSVLYRSIRKNFSNFIKEVLNAPAILFLSMNSADNIEFNAEIQNINEIDFTAESKGASYKKMLCIAFDVSLLKAYSSKSFYRFAYHDGSLEGLDDRKKINYIDKMRSICKERNLQYIFTSIEDDIPTVDKSGMYIKESEVAVTLDDSGREGKLFKMDF